MITLDALWLILAKFQKGWRNLVHHESSLPALVPTSSDSTCFCSVNARAATDGVGSRSRFILPGNLTLQQNQVFRVPAAYREVQVLSGAAWVTFAGKDIILTCSERMFLAPGRDVALISVLGEAPVVLQICKHQRPRCRQ